MMLIIAHGYTTTRKTIAVRGYTAVRKNGLFYMGEFNWYDIPKKKEYLNLIYRGVDYIQAMEFMDL